ncbi:MAG: CdaR family protein [Lentisphaeria bacterium]
MKLRIPNFIKHDFPRKLVATFFAVLIWFAITNQLREFEAYHDIPVTLRYPPNKVVLEQKIFTADITLRGSRRRLEEIKSNDIRISADIPVVREGIYYYDLRLSADNVNTPPGTKVAQIDPQNIRVQLDRIVSKQVPVKVRETGELAYGYRVIEQSVVPADVTISGPSKMVNDIERIMTESIVLDESVASSFEMDNVKLISIAGIDVNPPEVHVAYEIGKHSGQQAFSDLDIRILNKSENNLTLKGPLPKAAITVRGPQLALENLKPHHIQPFIDISNITAAGRYNLPVQAWIDEAPRVMAEYIRPESVSMELIPAPTADKANDKAPASATDEETQ